MDPCMSKAHEGTGRPSSSLLAADEFSYKELLSLIRIRDFISFLLTYPVKVAEESKLKAWLNDVSEWTAPLFPGMLTDDHGVIRELSRLLTENPLRYMEGLMPLEIIKEIEDGGSSNFNNDDVTPIPEAILDLAVDLTVGQLIQTLLSGDDYVRNIHYVRLSTRNDIEKKTVMEKIESALKDKYNMVGIHKAFCGIRWIDASMYQGDVEVRVQEEIRHLLTEVEKEEDDTLCTRHIEEEMGSDRYLVLLVDGDSEKKLDLSKQRFPGTKFGGIVVLITTEPSEQRSDECRLLMDLNIRTQDHLLPWKVLCSYADSGIVHSSTAIQRIAVQIVGECRGHLLAIALVANSMKNVEDVKLWELALDKLCFTDPSYDYQETDRIGISRVMVNAFLNIIWEGINKTQKLCLELSLFVPNIKDGVPGETLISDWISVELAHTQQAAQHLLKFDSADTKLEYTRQEAERDLIELLDRFVFLQCGSSYVRLPKETYCILESLHNSNPSFIRDGAVRLIEPPHIGRWHALIRIELIDNKLCELPPSPNCPRLQVLMLQGNADLTEIPDSFFDRMPLLRYLDLSYTSIRYLPPSFSNLVELKKFYLRGCELFMELPPEIGELKALEKLDLDGTLITHMPKEIQELTNLQSLTLCFYGYHHKSSRAQNCKQCSNSTIIPPGVISNLTQLNYLSINVDPDDERWYGNVIIILQEIVALERLKTVSIYIPKAELLELIPARLSLNFRLVVGHHMQRFISRAPPAVEETFKKSDRSLKFVNGVDVPNEVNMILGRSRALYLDRHMTMKSLSEFQSKNLDMLQVCILAECNEMETVIDGSYSYDGHPLPYLRFLGVFYMKNLRSIYEGPTLIDSSFLHSLKSIALHTCPMLTTIFTLDFLDNLSMLEELIVEDCPKVTTLISHNLSKHETQFFLPRLRMLSLLYLPELVSISNGLHIGQNLEKMGFFCCPKLQSLSKMELSSKSLKDIKGESKWWEALKWNEAEWGHASQPSFLYFIFSPIVEEVDILAQLAAHDDEDQVIANHQIVNQQEIPEFKPGHKRRIDQLRLPPSASEHSLYFSKSISSGSFGNAGDAVKNLIPCASVAERNLLADTSKIVENNRKVFKRKEDLRKIVAESLSSLGYNSSICKSKWNKTSSYPAGEYEYIGVIVEGERLIVDIDFRPEFEIARQTRTYQAVFQSLPYIFVGKSDRLYQIVAVVSEAAKQSLKKKGMHVPPWRKVEYMLAKWLSSSYTTENPQALPSPTAILMESLYDGAMVKSDCGELEPEGVSGKNCLPTVTMLLSAGSKHVSRIRPVGTSPESSL